jgi:CubicO group peptidase (beta-lactamase class C family)
MNNLVRKSFWFGTILVLVLCLLPLYVAMADEQPATNDALHSYAVADEIFADFFLDAHIPGMVYGIVADGRLIHVKTYGVQDLELLRPVTPDSLFRIASMTKAFTALTVLKLRDDGHLRLDAAAEEYVPELRDWNYPTEDSPRIRVRDLLNHTSGLVTDDPWGDRQTPLPEEDFTQLLLNGVPFTRAPGIGFEYSNMGYALLGRTITNVSGHPFAETISSTLLIALDMNSSGFEADAAPAERRALGYRWENKAWQLEPTLGHGAFGAMGGLQTSANDYAKWVEFLLSAWPPRDGPDVGPVRRASIRELATGSNFQELSERYARSDVEACMQAWAYGMGMSVRIDCTLGFTLSHGGGYPGYGSHVLLLPDRGIGIFAFTNRTYANVAIPVWESAAVLQQAGLLGSEKLLPVGSDLATAYEAAANIFAAGQVNAVGSQLAVNFLLDRSADIWAQNLAELKAEVGDCDTSSPLTATGALSGEFTWRCAHGRVKGSLLLAPTQPPGIQELVLEAIIL